MDALIGLAGIYLNRNDLQGARETYLSASKVMPHNAALFCTIGAIDWRLVFEKKSPLPPVQQARVLSEGVESIDSALALDPDYEEAMTFKNLLLREQARLAVDTAEKARLDALAGQWFNNAVQARKRNLQLRGVDRPTRCSMLPPSPPPPPPPPRAR